MKILPGATPHGHMKFHSALCVELGGHIMKHCVCEKVEDSQTGGQDWQLEGIVLKQGQLRTTYSSPLPQP